MSDFDLDLGTIEREIDEDRERRIVLGVLDGSTPGDEWLEEIAAGNVCVLAVVGSLTEHAADFAPEVKEAGGAVVHFREFLVVTPPGVEVDTERL